MKAIVIATIFLAAGTACFAKGFKLVTSAPLNDAGIELPVKGRNGILVKQKLSFGDYYTTSVRRSPIRKLTGFSGYPGYIWTEHIDGKQSIKFRLTNGKDTSEVIAVSKIDNVDICIGGDRQALPGELSSILRIGTDEQSNNYSVAIYTGRDEMPWELFLDNIDAHTRREQYTGYIRRADRYYTITPLWQIERKGKVSALPFGTAGFEIRTEKGEARAAVSLIDNGTVYLGNMDEEERFLMANICSALLLHTNISE